MFLTVPSPQLNPTGKKNITFGSERSSKPWDFSTILSGPPPAAPQLPPPLLSGPSEDSFTRQAQPSATEPTTTSRSSQPEISPDVVMQSDPDDDDIVIPKRSKTANPSNTVIHSDSDEDFLIGLKRKKIPIKTARAEKPNQQTKLPNAQLDLLSPSDSDGAPPRRRLKKGSENSAHRAKASKPARKPLSELPLQTQKSYRAYISAVETGRLETVQSTLNRRPSFLNQADDKGVTPIMVAASVSNPDMVRLFLVQDDIEPNLQDQAGYTAMMWPEPTANGNYIRTLQTFVDHEKEHPGTLDFSKKDNKGTSAADYATWNLAQTKFSRQQKEQLRALIRDMTPSGA